MPAMSTERIACTAALGARQPHLGVSVVGESPKFIGRATLDERDVQRHGPILITSAARTTVDLARELPLREAVVTVDHALGAMVTRAELDRVLGRQRGWPGVRRARAAVAFADPRSESALESIARAAFAAAGLPEPELQVQFWDGERWLPERVDFWWPQFRTLAEADGLAKYEGATPEERRRRHRAAFVREQRLADRGVELVRFGWEDAIDGSEDLAARLVRAFQRGLRRTDPPAVWRFEDPYGANWPRLSVPELDSDLA